MECPFCKLELPEDSLFCQYCGKEIDFDLVASQEKEDVKPESAASSISEPIINSHVFCTKCGMRFEGAFCPVCGEPAVVKTEEYNAAVARINQTTAHIPVSTTKAINAPIEDKKIKTNTAEAHKKPRERKKWGKKQWIVSAGALVCVIILFFVGCYFYSLNCADKLDFTTAQEAFNYIPLGEKIFPIAHKYIYSTKDLKSGNYDETINTLTSLGDYRNAPEALAEAKRQKAWSNIERNHYADAISQLSLLSVNDDDIIAEALILQAYYEWSQFMTESGNHVEAYVKMQKANGYADAEKLLPDLESKAYEYAIKYYKEWTRNGLTSTIARSNFDVLDGYRDSEVYRAFVNARLGEASAADINLICDNVGFNGINEVGDAGDVLVCNQATAEKFLYGTWKGDGKYFTMKSDGDITYDIPWFNFGDYYAIENGLLINHKEVDHLEYFLMSEEEREATQKTVFRFTVISEDCIEVYSYKSNRTYTLYRQ